MSQARGSLTAVTVFEETTYNTQPGTPDGKKVYFESFTPSFKQALSDSNVMMGGRERGRPIAGNITVTGDLKSELSAEDQATLFKHAIGSVNTTGTGPYTHVISPAALPVGLGFEKDFGSAISGVGRYEYLGGCKIGQASIEFSDSGVIPVTFGIVGASSIFAASPLDATVTDTGHTSFSGFDGTIQEGGSSIAVVTKASIQINNELDESTYTIGGQGIRQDLSEGFSTISGSLTALFRDMTLLNKARSRTETSLKITASRGDGLGSAGNESMEFFVQHMIFEGSSPAIEGPKGIMVTLPFKAFINSTNAFLLTIKNALSTV